MGMANLRAGPTADDDMATGVGGLSGPGTRRWSGWPICSATASPPATPPPPPGRNDYLMRQAPPVSAVVPVKLTMNGKATWTFVWFGYMKNARNEGIALCSVTDGGNYYGSGGCEAATVGEGKVAKSDGGAGSIRLGTVVRRATSVTAVLGDGRRVPGVLAFGRGFPYKVWRWPTRRKTTPTSSSPTTAGTSSASSRSARSIPLRDNRAAAGSWCSATRLTCWSQPRAR
jgi:hypothetical protein